MTDTDGYDCTCHPSDRRGRMGDCGIAAHRAEWSGRSRVITTTAGTTVQIVHRGGDARVYCDHRDLRPCEVGRIVDGSFQPAPPAEWALRPAVLRAIAELIEEWAR